MLTIALASFKEAISKKIVLIISLLTLLYLVLFSILMRLAFKDLGSGSDMDSFIIRSAVSFVSVLGFYFSSMIVAFLTIMVSVGAVSSEIENGTIQAIISRPLKRSHYVLGKYLGLALLTVAYSTLLFICIVLISVIMGVPPLNHIGAIPFIKGIVFFGFEPLAILALCLFGSTLLKTIGNGILVIGIYILGMVGNMMEQIGVAADISGLENWGVFLSLVSPFDSIYRKMISEVYSDFNLFSALSGPFMVSGKMPSAAMMWYIVLYSVVFVCLGIRRFSKRDI